MDNIYPLPPGPLPSLLRLSLAHPYTTGAPQRREPATIAQLLTMPLDVFARTGQPIEVRVPWLDVTLWMVPNDQDGDRLLAEGVSKGRIWTAGELLDLMAIADGTPETVKTVTHAKLEVDGEIIAVRPRGDGR